MVKLGPSASPSASPSPPNSHLKPTDRNPRQQKKAEKNKQSAHPEGLCLISPPGGAGLGYSHILLLVDEWVFPLWALRVVTSAALLSTLRRCGVELKTVGLSSNIKLWTESLVPFNTATDIC